MKIIRARRRTKKELLTTNGIELTKTIRGVVILKKRTQDDILALQKLKDIVDKFIPTKFIQKYPDFNTIDSKCRKKELINLKHIFLKIAFDDRFSPVSIGYVLYRGDHSVIYKNLKTCNNLIQVYPEFKELYLTISKEYNQLKLNELINNFKESNDSRIFEYTNTEQNIT